MIEGPPLPNPEGTPWVADYAEIGAAARPDQTALIAPELGSSLTYRELDRRSKRAVALFREHGLEPGDRLAYYGRNSDLVYVLLIAAARSGVIFTPLNWRCAMPEIAFFLADSEPKLIFCDFEFLPTAKLAMEKLPRQPRIFGTHKNEDGDKSFISSLAENGPIISETIPKGDSALVLLYTSGTSGPPKGVLTSHRGWSLMRHSEMTFKEFPHWTGETHVSGMPTFHVAGLTFPQQALIHLSTCVLTNNPSAANLLHLIRQYGATRTFAVPTVIREIVDEVRRTGVGAPTLKMFFYGAMPIGESLLRDAIATLGCSFGQYYGMTEITGSATFLSEANHTLERPDLMLSVGLPFPGYAIDIRDPDGVPLPPGRAGEIYIRAPTLMSGYRNRPEATEAAMVGDWYRTGDGGQLDAQGFLYLTDRIKDMIVTGGENVYPIEVEEILSRHPAVQSSAIIGQPDRKWGEAVTALVQLRYGHSVEPQELIAFTREHLAAYKCPKTVRFVQAMPRTASGKLQRAKARAEHLAWLAETETKAV